MRAWIIGLALLAAPALSPTEAQPALDGKATLSGPVADILGFSAQPLSKEAMRSLISAYINKPTQTPEEKDFFGELASGAAVDVGTPAKTIKVAPLSGEPLVIAKLIASPPNLNTLWKQHGQPAQDMLEIARWGDRGRARVVSFMGNTLYGAWTRSAVQNGYTPWMDEYSGAYGAFERLADPKLVTEAKLLLKDAMVQVFAKCKADGREPPPLFLYDMPLISVGVPRP